MEIYEYIKYIGKKDLPFRINDNENTIFKNS